MTKAEALKIIEEHLKSGGNMFIDGCKGLSDRDLIYIAEKILELKK